MSERSYGRVLMTDLYEINTHPFIVKVWLEETVEETGWATWRGYITHVPTGQRRYFEDLEDIPAFIAPYLVNLGVDFGLRSHIKRWSKWISSRFGRMLTG